MMNRPLLGFVGLIAAGGVAVGVYVALPGGGEEEVLQDLPTATDTVEASPSVEASASPKPDDSPTATPAAGRAPDGCIAGEEKAYEDPDGRFAFCYPAKGGEVSLGETPTGVAANLRLSLGEGEVFVIFGLFVDPYAPCGIASDSLVRNQRTESVSLGGELVDACVQDHYDPVAQHEILYSSLDFAQLSQDGERYVIFATYPTVPGGQPVGKELALKVLQSTTLANE